MKRIVMRAALSGACAALALPAGLALADETSDLKAEIAAQRAQLEEQRLRLEAMEKKLDAATQQQQAAAPAATQPAAQSASWAPKLIASADWQPGFTFQVTPVDTVTLYGLIDAT